MRAWVVRFVVCVLCLGGLLSDDATAVQTYLDQIARDFSWPAYAGSPPGDTNRLFVAESNTGLIKVVDLNTRTTSPTPFLSITTLPTQLFTEQGLLGMAFDPNFSTNGYFYVDYTGNDAQIHVVRYQVQGDPATSLIADPTSAQTVLTIDHPGQAHNGGWLAFGPNDGYLYVGVGDGGNGYDTGPGHNPDTGNAQDITDNLLGKILRVDVHGDDFPADANRNYAIPPSNPFVGKTGDDEIWAYGLRNPWRDSFDRQTGDLWIGDVGQGDREEIDFQSAPSPGGENYGWRLREGTIATPVDGIGGPAPPGAVEPVYDYDHYDPDPTVAGYAVIGGYVYRGPVAAFQGDYFFADYGGNVWKLDPDAVDVRASVTNVRDLLVPNESQLSIPSSFGEDAAGNLYLMNLFVDGGIVYRLATHAQDAAWVGSVTGQGDGTSWGSLGNWVRGGQLGAPFVEEDNLVFYNFSSSSQPVVHLDADHTAAAITFKGSLTLQDHNLQLLSGNITVDGGVTATIKSNLSAESANHSLRKLGPGTLLVDGTAGQTVVKEGTLGGTGTLDYLTVRSGATVSPGDPSGTLWVNNAFKMESGAAMALRVGASSVIPGQPQNGVVAIGGTATVAGELDLSFADFGDGVFVPSIGNVIVAVWAAGGITGSFDSINLPELPSTFIWDTHYTLNAIYFTIDARLPGDYNGDGVVDAADYTVWRDLRGQRGNTLVADSSGPDGVADGLVSRWDYFYWKERFGNAQAGSGGASSVPEPASLWLLLAGILTLCRRRRATVP
jgi:glucose/arabinose dehydrogenase